MPVVVCPYCRNDKQSVADPPTYGDEEFCDRCDYPLFWAPRDASASLAVAGGPPQAAYRSPGVEGRSTDDAVICKNCLEPNVPSNPFCVRCSKDLPAR